MLLDGWCELARKRQSGSSQASSAISFRASGIPSISARNTVICIGTRSSAAISVTSANGLSDLGTTPSSSASSRTSAAVGSSPSSSLPPGR